MMSKSINCFMDSTLNYYLMKKYACVCMANID